MRSNSSWQPLVAHLDMLVALTGQPLPCIGRRGYIRLGSCVPLVSRSVFSFNLVADLLRLYFAARLEEFSGGVKRAARRTWRRESTASLDSGGTSEDELGLEGADDEAESAGGAAGGSSSLRRRRSRRSSSVMDEDDGMGGPGVAPHVEGGDAMEGVERSPGEAAHNRAGLVNKHLAGVLGDTGGGASAWGGGAEGTMEGVGIGEMVRLMGVEWVAGVAAVARQLRELGLGALAEAAVAQAVHEHLQVRTACRYNSCQRIEIV